MPRTSTNSNFRRRVLTDLIVNWRKTGRSFFLQYAADYADRVDEVEFLNWLVEWTR